MRPVGPDQGVVCKDIGKWRQYPYYNKKGVEKEAVSGVEGFLTGIGTLVFVVS